MSEQSPREPKIVSYNIPSIETYQITGDELERLEEATSAVENTFAFMLAGISVSITILIALVQGEFPIKIEILMKSGLGVSMVVSLWAGVSWKRHGSALSRVLSKIRSRRDEPGDD